MKLQRLAINQLPGISQPFEIELAEAGIHVVYGPNGIGKSSICRAVEGLYWNDRGSSLKTSIIGEFELEGEVWWVEREGSRQRWQRGGEDSLPPNLPASHNHRCFFLRLSDLIDPSPDGTQDIASEIRRQMSGGFDLDKIASDLFARVGTQHGRKERTDFNTASQDVQEAEGFQSSLQRRADRLDALMEQLNEAESSALRLTSVDRALGLAKRVEEYTGVVEEIAVQPEGLTILTGNEVEQIEKLQGQIDGLNKRSGILEGQRKAAYDANKNSRLSAPLDKAELAIWREKVGELSRVELSLKAARTDRSACKKELAAALSALGGGNVDEVNLDLDDHSQLFEFLRAVEANRASIQAIKARLRLLTHIEQSDDDPSALENFRSAVDALRSWLRAPEPESLSRKIKARRFWILFGLALTISGAALAVFIEPMFALLAAVGVGVVVPVIMLRSLGATSDDRETAQDAFAKLDIEEPDVWDVSSVELRLRSLESEIATIDAQIQRARARDGDRKILNSDLEGLSEDNTLIIRRKTLIDSLKLDAILPDAELVDFARALDQFRAARIKDERVAGEVDQLDADCKRLILYLASVLDCHGEQEPEDSQTAEAYLNRLSDRSAQLLQAISDEHQVTEQLDQISFDHGVALNSIKQIYSDLSLDDGDLPGLMGLLNSLPDYLKLKKAATELEAQIKLDKNVLAKAGEASLVECDRPTLEKLQGEISQRAKNAPELRDEIARINAQVNEAKCGSNLQNLIALREDARTNLLDSRDKAFFAKAGKFLIDAVEAEYEQTQMPRVFERARSHFSIFTHHNYDLRLGKEAKAPRLFAVELRSGEGRGLDELSDGTRAQLLLAARIAFAEEVEQGRTLPLFLDEALDQSDPARFEAIVRSLGRIANDQERQIIYLTSDPFDTDRIRHALAKEDCEIAAVLDLGLIRTKAVSVSGPQALRITPRPTVPTPNGLSVEEYGAALGVPVLAPAQGYAWQHFFYVLSDDLNLLHNFLVNGIEWVGQWKTVSGNALADKLGSRSISSREIAFRVDLLEVFCELWKQGRGRPVDREALEQSGALSERYLDDVVAIADEVEGDPERLLSALGPNKESRPKGFRQNRFESLEKYLRDNGYTDDQQVLSESELRLHALASPAAIELREGIASDCLNRWWELSERFLYK
jgi:DNA repair protein SbcC/Rad50